MPAESLPRRTAPAHYFVQRGPGSFWWTPGKWVPCPLSRGNHNLQICGPAPMPEEQRKRDFDVTTQVKFKGPIVDHRPPCSRIRLVLLHSERRCVRRVGRADDREVEVVSARV